MIFFIENLDELNYNHVKDYQIENLVNGEEVIYTRSISHSCYVRFKFHNQENIINTHFDEYDLTTDDIDHNVNADYNKNLKVIKLYETINGIISELKKDNKFIRIE